MQFRHALTNAIDAFDWTQLAQVIPRLCQLKQSGRLFLIGLGGSAANASHAVNDFRKIADIEAYAPTDNVAELTARTNDQGFAHVFSDWLTCSRLNGKDVVMVFSVGGGSFQHQLSVNLCHAVDYAHTQGADTIVISSRPQGYCLEKATYPILIPIDTPNLMTPTSETLQAMVWHALVSHPRLQINGMTWEERQRQPQLSEQLDA